MDRPPSPRRRGRPPSARREDILEAALDVFGEKGFAATRLDEVAARAGVSKGTLYLYFPSKEEMFKAMVRHAVLPNVGEFEAMAAAHPGPASRILTDILPRVAHLFGATRVGRIPKMVLTEAGLFPDLARFWVTEVVDRGVGALRAILERGVREGEFAPIRAETTFLVMSPMLMLAMWNTGFGPATGRRLDPALLAEEAVRVLLLGLKVRGEEP